MALTVGDVVYKIGADVSGLNKAVSQLNKFKKSITDVEAAAKKAKAALGKGFVINVNYAKVTGAIKALDALAASAAKAQSSVASLSSKSINLNVVSKGTKQAIADLSKLESKLSSVAKKAKALNIDVSSSLSSVEGASMAVARGYTLMGAKGDKVFVQQKKQLASLLRQYEAFKTRQQVAGLPGGIGATVASSLSKLKEQVDLYDEAYKKYKKYSEILAKEGTLKGNQLAAFEKAKQTMEELRKGALDFDEFNDKIIRMQNSLSKANNEFRKIINAQKLVSKVELEKTAAATRIDELKRQFAYLKASPKLIEQADAAYQKLASTLDAMAKKGAATAGSMAKAKAEFQRTFTALSREAKVLEKGMTRTTVVLGNFIQGIKSVGTAYAAFLVFQGLQDAITGFFEISDATKLLRTRIRQVTKTADEFKDAWSGIFDIAERTRSDFQAIGKLYFRVAAATRPLGRSQEEVLKVTETVSAALLAGGASAQEAASATLQLSQAFAKGKLDGDELRAVLENAQILTAAMGRQFGVTAGDVKSMTGVIIDMARRGELTIDKFFDAILKSHDEMLSLIEDVPLTMGQAWTLLKNRLAIVIDKLQQATDWSGKLASVIKTLAMNVNELTIAFSGLLGVLTARAIVKGIPILKRDTGDIISAIKRQVVQLARAFTSLGAAKDYIKGIFKALKAVPFARVLMGVVGAIFAAVSAWSLYKDTVVDTVDGTQVTIGDYVSAIAGMLRHGVILWIDKFKAAWKTLTTAIPKLLNDTKQELKGFVNFWRGTFIGELLSWLSKAAKVVVDWLLNGIPRAAAFTVQALQTFIRFIKDPSFSIKDALTEVGEIAKKASKTDFVGAPIKKGLESIEETVRNAKEGISNFAGEVKNTFRQAAAAEARLRKKREQEQKRGGLTKPPTKKPGGLSEEEMKSLERAVKAYTEQLRQMRLELAAISSIPTGQWAKELNAAFGADWVNRYVSAVIDVKNTYKDLNEKTWPEFKKKTGVAQKTLEEFINSQIRLRLSTEASKQALNNTVSAFETYKDLVTQASRAQQELNALLSGGQQGLAKLQDKFDFEGSFKNINLEQFNKQMEAAGLKPVASLEELRKRFTSMKQAVRDIGEFKEIFDELTPEVDKINQRFDNMRAVIMRVIPAGDAMREKLLKNLEEMRQKALESVDPFLQMANEIGEAFGRAFEDAIVEGKKFSDVIKQLEKDILRLVTRKVVTEPLSDFISGAIKGSGFGGFFKNLFGFAHGGQFQVKGVGGIDSQLVAFWATPGETVTVTPPGQPGGSNMNVTININTPTGTVDPQSLGQIQAALARATQRGARNL